MLRAVYDAEEKRLRDELSALHYERKEDREEGREEEKRASALNLLNLGVTPNIISQSIGRDEAWVLALKESK